MAEHGIALLKVVAAIRKLSEGHRNTDEIRRLVGSNLVEALKFGAFAGAEYAELRYLINLPETPPVPHNDLHAGWIEALEGPANRAVWWLKRHKQLPSPEGDNSYFWFPDSARDLADLIEAEAKLITQAPRSPMDPNEAAVAMGNEAKAIAFLFEHPEWSNQKIADAVGCTRQTLYRWKAFCSARALLKQGRTRMPKGRKDAQTGTIEAWDKDGNSRS